MLTKIDIGLHIRTSKTNLAMGLYHNLVTSMGGHRRRERKFWTILTIITLTKLDSLGILLKFDKSMFGD